MLYVIYFEKIRQTLNLKVAIKDVPTYVDIAFGTCVHEVEK